MMFMTLLLAGWSSQPMLEDVEARDAKVLSNPLDPDACQDLFDVAVGYLNVEEPDFDASSDALGRMVAHCDKGTPWWEANRRRDRKAAWALVEMGLVAEAQHRHLEAMESRDAADYVVAAEWYVRALEVDGRPELRWYYADCLFNAEMYEETLSALQGFEGSEYADGALFQTARTWLILMEAQGWPEDNADARAAVQAVVDAEFTDEDWSAVRERNLADFTRYLEG